MKNFTKSTTCALFCCCLGVSASAAEKPKLNAGVLLHTYVQAQQKGFGESDLNATGLSDWEYGASVYRARVLLETNLTEKDYLFFETEVNANVGLGGNADASIRVLDAQYDHKFFDQLTVSAGKMLVSFNRNGLQTASTLMANDFTYFQYMPMIEGLMGNDCGRDVGINLSGGFCDSKLTYRLGSFIGDYTKSLRTVGRVQYNIFDKDLYSGTNLGEGKTLSFGAGFDTQSKYLAVGVDAYLDLPVGDAGSLTANLAYAFMSGDISEREYVSGALAEQNVYFLELGYYFKSCKLQPWVKFESAQQTSVAGIDDTVYGGGLNYFFNGYGTNLRLSYTARENSVINKSYSQIQLQLQLFLF